MRLYRSRLGVFLRWGFGLAMVAAMLLLFDVRSIGAELRQVEWALAAPAIAALVLVQVLAALTWRFLSDELSHLDMGALFSVRTYFAAQALGSFTPGNVGADAYRVHALGAGTEGWRRVVFPILVQRLTSYVALAAMGIVATFYVPVAPLFRLALLAIPVLTLGLAAGAWLATRQQRILFIRVPDRLRTTPGAGAPWLPVLGGTVLAAMFHVIGLAFSLILLASVTRDVDMVPALAALTIARVTTVLPLTPNGLGFQEGALALLLPEIGTTAEVAVAVAALNRLAMLVTMTAGFAILAAGTARFGRPARAGVLSPES